MTDAGQGTNARDGLVRLHAEVAKVVLGQDAVISGVLVGLLAGGHVLLEGVPGTAKTMLVRARRRLDLTTTRMQFTPDLMPSDVTGSLVFDQHGGEFAFRPGPVFTNLLLADEINRTPPKTQASLLEAMEERQVTVDGGRTAAARPVLRGRHPEPGRVRGHLPAAGGAARPVPAQADGAAARPPRPSSAMLAAHVAGFDPRDLAAAGVHAVATPADLAAAVAAVRPLHVRTGDPRLRRRAGARHPRAARGVRSASRRAAPPPCSPPPAPGRSCPAATTSRPTTSRPWPGRCSGTG